MKPHRLPRARILALGAAAVAVPHIASAQAATVRVGASAAATQAEAYYGEQLGVFKDAGIKTTSTIVTRSSDSLSALLRGDLDVGSTTPQVIANAIIHGLPIQVIATGGIYAGDPRPVQLVVSKKAPLHNEARYYEDKTIAVQTLNDSQSVGMLAWLQQHHAATGRVKFVEITFPTIPAALDRGEVPHVYDALGTHWALGAWFARKDWIAKDPSLVRAFVGGLYATAKKVNPNPSMVDELLTAYSKVPIEKVRITPKPIWAEKAERTNLEPQIQAAAEFKIISRPVSYHEMTGA